MRIGLFIALGLPGQGAELLAAIAQAAEGHGIESLWLGEHVILFDEHEKAYPYAPSGDFPIKGEGGMTEPFTTLSFCAALTSRIRLGTAVCLVPQRNPLYTAKEVANVDWLSNGRFDFGIGVGWQREEFDALHAPFAERGRRTDEYIEMMRRLWCEPVSSFAGEFWQLPPCRAYPKPVQQPHPPIYVGGESEAALRRVVRLDGQWFPWNLDADGLAVRRRRLGDLLVESGSRSIDDMTIIVNPSRAATGPDHVAAFADAGADQVVVHLPRGLTVERVEPVLDDLAAAYGLG